MENPETRTCQHCHRTLPTSEFYHDARYAGGLSLWCKRCHREYQLVRRHGTIERAVAHLTRTLSLAQLKAEVARREALGED